MTVSPLASPAPWDLVSSAYDAELRTHFSVYAEEALRRAAPRGKVLDVAAGPGTLALLAARAGAEVTALDFAPDMIARLRANAAQQALTVDAVVGDAMAMPFADGAFDAAYCMFGVMFFPDRKKGLAELRRVVRAGGHATVTTWPPMNRIELMCAAFDALRAHVPGLPPNDGTAPLGTLDEMRRELADAGFVGIETAEVTHSIEVPGASTFWGFMQRTTAPIVMMQKRMGAAWAAVDAAVSAAMTERFGDAPRTVSMAANMAVARV